MIKSLRTVIEDRLEKARGNWGHSGRPGERGGSGPGDGGGGDKEKVGGLSSGKKPVSGAELANAQISESKSKEATGKEDTSGAEVLKSIDFKGLEQNLSSRLGTPIKLTASVANNYANKPYIKFESQDLTDQAGIFKAGLKSVKITAEGSYVDDVKGEESFGANMHLRFELKDGGSNGIGIGRAWNNTATKEWAYKNPGE